jgi:hypothetical protein
VLMHGTITGITHSTTRKPRSRIQTAAPLDRVARWGARIGYYRAAKAVDRR